MTDILSLGKSRGRLVGKESTLTFQDVGGCQEAKELLGDVVDFLKNPQRWNQAGARLPRGVLLEGPPGCGKTLLARAVAGETNARFYTVSASEFVEMFVGVGAHASATCSRQPPNSRRRSSSSTNSTPSADAEAPASDQRTTNASKRSISCWSVWTGLPITRRSLCWRPRIGPTFSIRPCCVPAASIVVSVSPRCRVTTAGTSCAFTRKASRWPRMFRSTS